MTTDGSPNLAELEGRMGLLVRTRREVMNWLEGQIAFYRQQIKMANCDFDREAVKLGREIEKLRGENQQPVAQRRQPVHDLEGLTDAEREHFQRLARGGDA